MTEGYEVLTMPEAPRGGMLDDKARLAARDLLRRLAAHAWLYDPRTYGIGEATKGSAEVLAHLRPEDIANDWPLPHRRIR